jgi:Cu(I)/Ag(I) efflux system membrane fusion protein
MRRVALGIAVVAAITASYMFGRRSSQGSSGHAHVRHVLYYVDPMHPSYKSDKPGIAPDCGMKLEPVYAEDAGSAPAMLPVSTPISGAVSIDSSMQKLLGIRVASAIKGSATRQLRVIGRVAPEDTRVYRINAGVDGFIRETFDDSVGTHVKKDQKLATYYSPEFLAVASGFLAASERVPGAVGTDGARTVPFPGAVSKQGVSSIQGYMDRLQNLGMSEVQIQHIADSRQLPENIDVVSPTDGFVLSRSITPGQHFDHAMEFYRVADLQRVWVLVEVDDQEASYVHAGSAATISLSSGAREWPAKITESLPQSEAAGGTTKLRLEVANPGFLLRPDMVVDVKIPVRMAPGVTVPVDALVDTGARPRVYVERSEGVFEPREVETGWRSGDQVEIRAGVRAGEHVVVAATFLVDSESRLKSPVPLAVPEESRATAKRVLDPGCAMPGSRSVTDQGAACKNNLPNQTSNMTAKQMSGR